MIQAYQSKTITPLFYAAYVLLKAHNSCSSALHKKNYFLSQKITINRKLVSFFIHRGKLNGVQRDVTFVYLQFLRELLGLHVVAEASINCGVLLKNNVDFLRLFRSNPQLYDFGFAFMFRAIPLLPCVKAVCIRVKNQKKKKR